MSSGPTDKIIEVYVISYGERGEGQSPIAVHLNNLVAAIDHAKRIRPGYVEDEDYAEAYYYAYDPNGCDVIRIDKFIVPGELK